MSQLLEAIVTNSSYPTYITNEDKDHIKLNLHAMA